MSDRVELTGPEKREFERQYRHALRGRIELEGLTFPPTPQLLRSVESIVAAHVQALTAERDQWKFRASVRSDLAPTYLEERDAARADLAAANARCAELEARLDGRGASQEFVMRFSEAEFERLEAERDALQATLDRVTALADEWNNSNDSRWIHAEELLAALTPEGKP